uniref:Uncharacterized protein n=1 Tax=Panagrolaimus sp. PS1159 TaxID=55785 RepID=A0AC35F5W7_9BILA
MVQPVQFHGTCSNFQSYSECISLPHGKHRDNWLKFLVGVFELDEAFPPHRGRANLQEKIEKDSVIDNGRQLTELCGDGQFQNFIHYIKRLGSNNVTAELSTSNLNTAAFFSPSVFAAHSSPSSVAAAPTFNSIIESREVLMKLAESKRKFHLTLVLR